MLALVTRFAAAAPTRGAAASTRGAAWRAALVAGACVAAVAAWVASSSGPASVDADLETLLRGMGAIKLVLAAGAAGLVWWRLGRPVSRGAALAYVASVWLLVAGGVCVWQLASMPAAVVHFHAGELTALAVAWFEGLGRAASARAGVD